ncbi:hypothetical protein ALP37_200013 [Pseudomonas amygdali pv. sesami]|nr:hypothetical protein ALP37_200013 [Pseudomonas amygdali pv. sesami]
MLSVLPSIDPGVTSLSAKWTAHGDVSIIGMVGIPCGAGRTAIRCSSHWYSPARSEALKCPCTTDKARDWAGLWVQRLLLEPATTALFNQLGQTVRRLWSG